MLIYKKMYKKENSEQFAIKISYIKEKIIGIRKELKKKTHIKEEVKKKKNSAISVWEISNNLSNSTIKKLYIR